MQPGGQRQQKGGAGCGHARPATITRRRSKRSATPGGQKEDQDRQELGDADEAEGHGGAGLFATDQPHRHAPARMDDGADDADQQVEPLKSRAGPVDAGAHGASGHRAGDAGEAFFQPTRRAAEAEGTKPAGRSPAIGEADAGRPEAAAALAMPRACEEIPAVDPRQVGGLDGRWWRGPGGVDHGPPVVH